MLAKVSRGPAGGPGGAGEPVQLRQVLRALSCGWMASLPPRLRASDIMEPNLTYVYPHTRIQSLVSILRTTVHHAFPVVTENRGNEKEFMKGNQLISNNIKFKVKETAREETGERWLVVP